MRDAMPIKRDAVPITRDAMPMQARCYADASDHLSTSYFWSNNDQKMGCEKASLVRRMTRYGTLI